METTLRDRYEAVVATGDEAAIEAFTAENMNELIAEGIIVDMPVPVEAQVTEQANTPA